MKPKIYSKLLPLSMLMVFFTLNSCNEPLVNSTLEENDKDIILKSGSIKSQLIEDYALLLSNSLSPEIKALIKSEAKKKFDGDYDILAATFEEFRLSNGKYIKDIIKETKDIKLGIRLNYANLSGEEFLQMVSKEIPNLQISVPIHCENWKTEDFTPLVAFVPEDFRDGITKQVRSFGPNGVVSFLDTEKEPPYPVIVVSISERVNKNKELKKTFATTEEFVILKSAPIAPSGLSIQHGNSLALMLSWNDTDNETSYEIERMAWDESQFWPFSTTSQNQNGFINNWTQASKKYWYRVRAKNADGTSAYSNTVASTSSARNDGESLKIKRMKFSSSALSSVESWVSGAPELRLRVVVGGVGTAIVVFTSGVLEPSQRNDINGTWWNREVLITNWYTNSIGTVLNFDWREEDVKNNATFQISGSYEDTKDNGTIKTGSAITITNNEGVDFIGSQLIFWWDTKDQIYNLSGFEYQFVY